MSGKDAVPTRHSPTVSWFELFYDLLVVAAISLTNDLFLDSPSTRSAVSAGLGLVALSWVWFMTTLLNNMHPGQGLIRRLIMLVQMALIVAAALAMDEVGGGESARALAAYGGALVTVIVLILVLRPSRPAGQARPWTGTRALAPLALGAVLCLLAIPLPESADRWLLLSALAVMIVPTMTWQYPRWEGGALLRADHLRERLGLFVLIVLGEGFAQLVSDLHELGRIPHGGLFAVVFLLSYALWWIYFDGTFSESLDLHRVRWRLTLLGHLLLVFGIMATLDILVLLSVERGNQVGDHVLPYFCVAVAVTLLAFALLRFTAHGRLGGPGLLHVGTAVVVLMLSLVPANQESEGLYLVIIVVAVLVIANGLAAAWADRTLRTGGMRTQFASLARGYEQE